MSAFIKTQNGIGSQPPETKKSSKQGGGSQCHPSCFSAPIFIILTEFHQSILWVRK